ncbi:MAG: deoxyguanosinetriphosphate triphosphohydrolase, partial [Propionibacteriaceae bacterium]|nr:deoxyguanosinetriphosphate triphosphohydrolase [Propionibacteriaceae bacterium]
EVAQICGRSRREQLSVFIRGVVESTVRNGFVSLDPTRAAALSSLRSFNYERIYTREEALAQSHAVIAVLRALVEHYASHLEDLPPGAQEDPDPLRAAVSYVGGMTDRFAFNTAMALLDWDSAKLPKGIG